MSGVDGGSFPVQGDSIDALPGLSKTQYTKEPQKPMVIYNKSYVELRDDDFEYKMNNRRRGRAVIVNNQNFLPSTQMGDRNGSDVDRDNLYKTLTFLGFKVEDILVKNNLSVKELLHLLNSVATENHKDSDCLLVAILSHGDEDRIYGTDGPVPIEGLLRPFKEPGSESLIGKPKIFLLQACRGEKLDEGRYFATDAGPAQEKPVYKIAKESDFLIAYSVVPGYYSWRNCSNGSWFIQAFCEVMRRDGRRLEFVQALTRVNRMVSYTFESNAKPEYMSMKKQSPCITSMLTKSLYF